MVALIIETATERAITAIVKDDVCLYGAGLPIGYQNSKFLIPKIEEGLMELKMSPQDLNVIVVGTGPGSYTGIRVGVAVAKTLAYSCQIPLVGIGTLEGFLPDREGVFCAILDAKMSGFYVMKGSFFSGEVIYDDKPFICSPQDIGSYLENVEILVTPSIETLKNKVDNCCPNNALQWQETAADPLVFSRISNKKLSLGEYSLKGELDILYLK